MSVTLEELGLSASFYLPLTVRGEKETLAMHVTSSKEEYRVYRYTAVVSLDILRPLSSILAIDSATDGEAEWTVMAPFKGGVDSSDGSFPTSTVSQELGDWLSPLTAVLAASTLGVFFEEASHFVRGSATQATLEDRDALMDLQFALRREFSGERMLVHRALG